MCGDGIITLPSLQKSQIQKCSVKIRAVVNDMSQPIVPSTHNFSAIHHKMTMKATSPADHNRSSRNKDCVTVFFRMKIVVNISMASGTLSVIDR